MREFYLQVDNVIPLRVTDPSPSLSDYMPGSNTNETGHKSMPKPLPMSELHVVELEVSKLRNHRESRAKVGGADNGTS